MKKILSICAGILLSVSMLFVACKPGEENTPTINKFFTVEDGLLVAKDMPQANSDQEIAVVMNNQVIPGGTSYVSLTSETQPRTIYVGMKDQLGYYEVPVDQNRGYDCSFVMMVAQDINLADGKTVFTIQVALEDQDGNISKIWESEVELHVVGTGTLQVSLTFDNAKDVDLHLIEPEYNDEYGNPVSFYDRHIYYGNRFSHNGGELDLDSNPGCSIDNINNENITYNDSTSYVAPGLYKVYVDLFENCESSVATNYVVSVFYGGALIATQQGTNPASGVFPVGAESTYNPISQDYVAENAPFISFVIPDHGQKRVKTFEPAPMTESAIEKEAMSAAAR